MNIKKFGKRLVKINRLFESIQEDGEVSPIERDLLLSYLREAYEYALSGEVENESKATKVEEIAPAQPKTFAEQKHHVSSVAQARAPQVSHAPPPAPVQPVMQQIAATEVDNTYVEPKVASTPEPVVVYEAPVKAPVQNTIQEMDVAPKEEVLVDENDPLTEIFRKDGVTDLSDRLSMTALPDITKAMGINEKILTIRELFGGDTEIFNMVMNRLNKFDSYEHARDYLLTGIAKDQNWGSDSKIKKAEQFVKLVKRRYA